MQKLLLCMFIIVAAALNIIPMMTAGADQSQPGQDFTQNLTTNAGALGEQQYTMIYVEGGAFTLGWTSPGDDAPEDTTPVEGVTVSSYYICETEVTQDLWWAVMGGSRPVTNNRNRPKTGVNWYQVQEFLSRLYVLTGKVYRLPTEAEWEFAAKGGNPGFEAGHHAYLYSGSNNQAEVAVSSGGYMPSDVKTLKPNILGIYDMSGNVEELVYNSWNKAHIGGTDPIGPEGHLHNQKTRRGGYHGGTTNLSRYATARQIRSIDGSDGGLGFRIALSANNSVPPGMIRPRDIRHPEIDDRDTPNSYRDPRWITGHSHVWIGNFMGMMETTMKLWDTGEMVIVSNSRGLRTRAAGQWYSVNNVAVIFVPNEGERVTIPYVFMDYSLMTVINDRGFFVPGAPYGRFEKLLETGTPVAKPVIQNLQTPEKLAEASSHDHNLYDMDNIPLEARGQDPRLLDGAENGWHQGLGGGGLHQYRKDIDPVTGGFRFSVYLMGEGGFNNVLTRGDWFTVNDTFLRVTDSSGKVADYVYAVTPNDELLHISFQDYEKGDPRVFKLTPNPDVTGHTEEIPKGTSGIMGGSTFRQPPPPETPCPGGCGGTIHNCTCPTICSNCNNHIENCICEIAQELLDQSKMASQDAVNAIIATNATIAEHVMKAVQDSVVHTSIQISWKEAFIKTEATAEASGLITGTIRLTLGALTPLTEDVDVNLPIARLFAVSEANVVFAQGKDTATTNGLIATAKILSGADAGYGGLVTVRIDFSGLDAAETGRYSINLTGAGVHADVSWNDPDNSGTTLLVGAPIVVTWNGEEIAAETIVQANFTVPVIDPLAIEFTAPATGVNDLTVELEFLGELNLDLPIFLGTMNFLDSTSFSPPVKGSAFGSPALFSVAHYGFFTVQDQGVWNATDADNSGTWTVWDNLARIIVIRPDPGRVIPAGITEAYVAMMDFDTGTFQMTPAVGWRTTGVSLEANGDLTIELLWTMSPESITTVGSVAAFLTAPETGLAPALVTTSTAGVTPGSMRWSPDVSEKFAKETVYTVSFTVTASVGYEFAEDLTATVNGAAATVTGTDYTRTVSFAFPPTGPEPVIILGDINNNRKVTF